MKDCPFCQRIEAEDYGCWARDDYPDVVWFEPLNPVTPGHMLFVPRRHVPDALYSPYDTAITMEIAAQWGRRQGIEACNFISSVGDAATQTIRHLHIHLVPREPGDGLLLPWTGQRERDTPSPA